MIGKFVIGPVNLDDSTPPNVIEPACPAVIKSSGLVLYQKATDAGPACLVKKLAKKSAFDFLLDPGGPLISDGFIPIPSNDKMASNYQLFRLQTQSWSQLRTPHRHFGLG